MLQEFIRWLVGVNGVETLHSVITGEGLPCVRFIDGSVCKTFHRSLVFV